MAEALAVTAMRLDPRKFRDPLVTASGERRAHVALKSLDTLWFNTGTLCNLTCGHCYIESSPRNDRLVYLSRTHILLAAGDGDFKHQLRSLLDVGNELRQHRAGILRDLDCLGGQLADLGGRSLAALGELADL